ncbi:MAG TPA: DedA family protein [Gaiellaceae bacterium]|nr:DedA family protein [Gaiellaceae bacterium]
MTSWLAHYGVAAVFFLMMIDAVFPAASELVMVYGGALASGALTHEFDILGWHATGLSAYLAVVLAGVLGYQIGSIGGWSIGDRGGGPFVERYGRWFHLTAAKLERAEQWFARWNDWAVFVGRITPVARSFVSIPAGVFESPFRRYNVLTLAGNSLWCLFFAGIGWALGSNWDTFHKNFRWVEYLVVVGILVAVAYWVLRIRRSSTIASADDDPPR